MELNTIKSNVSWGEAASGLNENFSKIGTDLEKVKYATTRNKGYFSSDAELKAEVTSAKVGDIAYVGVSYPYAIWKWDGSGWYDSLETGGEESVDLGNYYTKDDISVLIQGVIYGKQTEDPASILD